MNARMSEPMRERVNEVIRWGLAKGEDITPLHLDQGVVHFGVPGWCAGFAAYTPWGVLAIERAFVERMRCPMEGESKRLLRRDIQSNPHLHPRIKATLLKTLRTTRVRYDWLKHLDSSYVQRILKGDEDPAALEVEIQGDTNLPERYRENLIFNLRQRHDDD